MSTSVEKFNMHVSTIVSTLLHLLIATYSLICDLRHISQDPICLSSSMFTQSSVPPRAQQTILIFAKVQRQVQYNDCLLVSAFTSSA